MTQGKPTQIAFRLAVLAIGCLSLVVYLGKAGDTLLRGIDSNIHAVASLNVTSQGFLPRLPILAPNSTHLIAQPQSGMTGELGPENIFNDHPFFFFYLNGWIMRALGPSPWSARLLTALFATGCVLLTLALGVALHSRVFGLLASLFYLFSRDMILTGSTVSLDPPMLFFILLSFYFWIKKRWVLVALTTGVGLWIKTPVVLLIYPVACLVSLHNKTLRKDWPWILSAATLSVGVGSLIWLVTGLLGGWPVVADYWGRQVFGTAIGGRGTGEPRDWFLFFKLISTGFLPGLPFLAYALDRIGTRKLWKTPPVALSLIAIGVLVTVISLLRFKMGYYYNPAFPFLALLSAYSLADLLQKREQKFAFGIAAGTLPLLAVLLASPISFGPDAFVALRKFLPLIQSYGSCQDRVYLVPGGEPVGGAHDYGLVINFNTGRRTEVVACEDLARVLQNGEMLWIILSEENFRRCLSPADLRRFSRKFLVDSQYLLTNAIPDTLHVDLTPLDRELKPAIDCKAALLKDDLYHRYPH